MTKNESKIKLAFLPGPPKCAYDDGNLRYGKHPRTRPFYFAYVWNEKSEECRHCKECFPVKAK